MRYESNKALLFFDVDGTLVWRDVEAAKRGEQVPGYDEVRPSPAVENALARLREQGHKVFICTGRALCEIPQTLRDLDPHGWILQAGSYVSIGDEVIRDTRIGPDLLSYVVAKLEELGIDAEFESNTSLLGFYPTAAKPRYPNFPAARDAEGFLAAAQQLPLAKFCVHDFSKVRITELLEALNSHFESCNLTHDVLEFSLPGCTKGSAIRAVLAHLGYDGVGTYAFGDSENDLSMAEAVDCFIALGNALEQVKERADYVALPVWQDGVPAALRYFGLI